MKPTEQLRSEEHSSTIADLENASLWHQEWKDRLRAAVTGHETLDPVVITCDDCCTLGKWLHAAGQKAYWDSPEFQELLVNHREFHMLAGAIAEIINDQQYELAAQYLSNDMQFVNASEAVTQSIRSLEAVVAG
jgi:hypothetical protein